MFSEKYKYHTWLHFTVLLFAVTGILGKSISASATITVWYRLVFAIIGIIAYSALIKGKFKFTRKRLYHLLLTGGIVGVHWITFFGAIKVSNVSLALVCFSTTTLFTALIEPIYFKTKIKPYEIIFGLIIIGGLYLVIFDVDFKYIWGIVLSVISAALASWFTVLNGLYIKDTDAKSISVIELTGALIVTSLCLPFTDGMSFFNPLTGEDYVYLLILGVVCTTVAFVLSVEVMKKLSPYTVTISVNLEPVYAIILAVFIWPDTESMSITFYLGAGIILACIFGNAYVKNRLAKR